MSSYTKSTNFASKDALLTGNPLKVIKGTEIDDEFNAIQTAVNSKANTNSTVLTGTPVAPTASSGTYTTQIATTAFVQTAVAVVQAEVDLHDTSLIEEGDSSVEVIDTGTGSVVVTVDGSEVASFDASGLTTTQVEVGDGHTIGDDGDDNLEISSSTDEDIVLSPGGTATVKASTDGNLAFNSGYGSVTTAYGCRAWVNFNGTGTIAIRDSGNVSSITDFGAGNYRVNFTNAMPDANYSVAISHNLTGTSYLFPALIEVLSTSVRFRLQQTTGTYDSSVVTVSVIR